MARDIGIAPRATAIANVATYRSVISQDTSHVLASAVERVLAARVTRPAQRKKPSWTRYALDHLRFHEDGRTGELRLVLTLCPLADDVDLRQLRHDLLSGNAAPSIARFSAFDGALHVEATVPPPAMATERVDTTLDSALDALLARASSYEAATLRRRYAAAT